MLIYDHLFVFLFAVAYPIYGFVSYRRFIATLADAEVVDRKSIYLETLVPHWVLFIVAIIGWWCLGRDWADIGIAVTSDPLQWWILAGIALVSTSYLILIWRLRTGRSDRQAWLEKMSNVEVLLPQKRDELPRFYALSVTAGIVEELLWRGMLIWYLQFAMPLWIAVLLSSVLFGLAHAYQGLKSMPAIVIVGFVFALIYVSTGSLLLAIVFHAVFDALQGRLAYEVLRSKPTPTP